MLTYDPIHLDRIYPWLPMVLVYSLDKQMTRAELIAELERLAQVFEGHPAHIGMSDTLRLAIMYLEEDYSYDPYETIGTREELERKIMMIDPDPDWLLDALKPSPPSSEPLPRTPDDT